MPGVIRASIVLAAVLTLGVTVGSASASFPGRNGAIVYGWTGESAFRGGPTATSIRTVDPRSARVRTLRDCPILTNGPTVYTECTVMTPHPSPDGRQIAFPMIRTIPDFTGGPWQSHPRLARMSSDGSGLVEFPLTAISPDLAWAPAGDRLLLARPPAVVLATLDGVEQGEATPAPSQEPDWSSRGEIAYAGQRNIFIRRLGRPPRRLTRRGGFSPSWSPHGTKLAFAREVRSGHTDIYIVGRDGSGLRRLTRRGGYGPAWAPDGKRIAFLRDGDLYVVRTDGRGLRRLVDSPSVSFEGPQVGSVDWQPLRGSAGARAAADTFFESPSGNIGCVISAKSGVRCDIRERDWRPPPKPRSCPVDWGNGVSVARRGAGRYTCAGDTVFSDGQALRYGRSILRGRFRCTSRRSGMRCINRRSAHGFRLSRQRVRLF
jgi:hypothetical protein